MAENEVNTEKKTLKISIWFILFLIVVIFSSAYILKLNDKVASLESKVKDAEYALAMANSNKTELIVSLKNDLENVIDSYLVEKQQEEKNNIEVTMGTYSSIVDGEEKSLDMILTLSENNIATLELKQDSGNSTLNGTYTVVDGTVVFASEDGLTTYSFTAVENGLKLINNDVDLTLSK